MSYWRFYSRYIPALLISSTVNVLSSFLPAVAAESVVTPNGEVLDIENIKLGQANSLAGKKWSALIVDGKGSRIESVTLRPTAAAETEPSQDGRAPLAVAVDGMSVPESKPLVLIGKPVLQEGSVERVHAKVAKNYVTIFLLGTTEYRTQFVCKPPIEMYAKNPDEGMSCKIFLTKGEVRQYIGNKSTKDDTDLFISWAGDIDRDGKLDFLASQSSVGMCRKMLFLSSPAEKGKLVKQFSLLDKPDC